MIFFRVTNNINIKITDGTVIKYNRFKAPVGVENETVYITTYDDFLDFKDILAKVDKNKYIAKTINENSVKENPRFPVELGILNIQEFENRTKFDNIDFFDIKEQNLFHQLKSFHKNSIRIAVIGSLGNSISDMISSMAALRIFYNKLSEIYSNVKLDIYIKASNNSYYKRDKDIYSTQEYINEILPLSIDSKKICEYDYYVDNSVDISKILNLNIVDSWLLKFGIDYRKVSDLEKFSTLKIDNFELTKGLSNKLLEAKKRGKLLLYHPYSATINKSIPQTFAIDILKSLIEKLDDYTIVTTLNVDPKIKNDNLLDLSNFSKTIEDFIFIVSSMDKIITANTSALHISDTFMIPTVCIITSEEYETILKYYKYVKPLFVKNSSKNLSKFIYENDLLTINKFDEWKKLKVDKIINLLETF
ncbi:hypothetical protein [Aliarcobacter vitoriensis]|uniref:Uncharacterized protein n=1 Tax=Aliarcobacter vitoriensis TaxID=2011099 RepID=A0A366MU01_9BACT|nr:hypothetical protein [Aliarcobacter vitoriensis]RBQ29725.1 hypothetical protein CRU91_01990 [Aliarcobacter vitoriensis]